MVIQAHPIVIDRFFDIQKRKKEKENSVNTEFNEMNVSNEIVTCIRLFVVNHQRESRESEREIEKKRKRK